MVVCDIVTETVMVGVGDLMVKPDGPLAATSNCQFKMAEVEIQY